MNDSKFLQKIIFFFIFFLMVGFINLLSCSTILREVEPNKEFLRESLFYKEKFLDSGVYEGRIEGRDSFLYNEKIVLWEVLDIEVGIPKDYNFGEPRHGFVQKIVSFKPAKGASFGHDRLPNVIMGAPKGTGKSSGSLDVVSLGCGGSIILEFSHPLIANGVGTDFIIFENAFGLSETSSFAEPAQVSVSIDGKKWYPFPCNPQKTRWPYRYCAGIRPVFANSDNKINPYDPKKAGGDPFDLDIVGLPFARFVKIEDRSLSLPDAAQWCGSSSAGFDLDAIAVIWGYTPQK